MSTATHVTTADGSPETRALPHRVREALANRAVQIILVEIVVIAVFQALSPGGAFLSEVNVRGMLLTASQVLLLTAGQAVLMSAGHIDVSQGAVLIVSSVVSGKVMIAMSGGTGTTAVLLVGLVVAVGTGAVLGTVNGIMTGLVGINSLVATLGMLSIGTGAAQVIAGGVNLTGLPVELASSFGTLQFGALPLPTLLGAVVLAVIWILFRTTAWGTHILAMGSNVVAARRVGIRTLRRTVGIFVLSSALAGLAGYIDLARYSTTNISGHLNDSMAAIAAALIGGTALTGGRINFLGAVFGALLAIILQSGLVIIDLSPFYQTITIGVMLLIAVSLDRGNRAKLGAD
ncbi:ABC transporter permease [Streptomyces sp. NPDC093109]|uniref:ABC transporter permease n=1 Tax=Streptomyces sp. NPDC093109 TaxID=3154977 RepID=UPI003450964E